MRRSRVLGHHRVMTTERGGRPGSTGVDPAEQACRSQIAAGDVSAHERLGRLLADRGDFAGAVEQFRAGAAAGDETAAASLVRFEGTGAMTATFGDLLFAWTGDDFEGHFAAVETYIEVVGVVGAVEAAGAWCESGDVHRVAAGFDVYGCLVDTEVGVVPLLAGAAAAVVGHPDEDVRWSAARALGRTNAPATLAPLLAFASDEDSDVRWWVTLALPSLVGEEDGPDHPAVAALLVLARDEDDAIRDWATFGLGQQLEVDSPAVREALFANLDDSDEDSDAAGEAALGLALRGDPRVFDVLVRKLLASHVGNLYVEAAGRLADSRLLPLLEDLRRDGWQDELMGVLTLDDAIARCEGRPDVSAQ